MTAPTLLDDWVTNTAFWWFALTAATTGVVWLTAAFITMGRAQDAEDEQAIPYGYCRNGHYMRSHFVAGVRVWLCIECDTCAIDGCTNPAAAAFYSPTGCLYVCRDCSGAVSEWTGPAIDQNEAS